MVVLKILLFTFLVPGTFAGFIPYLIVSRSGLRYAGVLNIFRLLGIVPIIVGLCVYIWCAWEFGRARGTPAPIGPPKELVMKGLYRFTRNPMYIGVLCLLVGESWFFLSLQLFLYSGLVFIIFQLFVVLYEEPKLQSLFGESYIRYRSQVPRWFWDKKCRNL